MMNNVTIYNILELHFNSHLEQFINLQFTINFASI